jgi:hypothetical protein
VGLGAGLLQWLQRTRLEAIDGLAHRTRADQIDGNTGSSEDPIGVGADIPSQHGRHLMLDNQLRSAYPCSARGHQSWIDNSIKGHGLWVDKHETGCTTEKRIDFNIQIIALSCDGNLHLLFLSVMDLARHVPRQTTIAVSELPLEVVVAILIAGDRGKATASPAAR